MHWDSSANAGFTACVPWLKPKDQEQINVNDELDHGEIFSYYQKLIYLGKNYHIIAYGDYYPFDPNHSQVFAYCHNDQEQTLIVVNNFYAESVTYSIPNLYDGQKTQILLNNYQQNFNEMPVTL